MDQIMIDIEDNENCGYFPIQVFETQGESRTASVAVVPGIPGSDEPHEVVGWCSDNGGSPCDVTVVPVGDSGSGQVTMIYGGDYGIRLQLESSRKPWSVKNPDQVGEPYMLLSVTTNILLREVS